MQLGVSLKIDVTKIDKEKLFRGQKGTYLDLTVFIDVDNEDQYGNNGMVTQSTSKEDREAGIKGAILGNIKVFMKKTSEAAPQQTTQAAPVPTMPTMDDESDIPW